jgi:hypothetical protein
MSQVTDWLRKALKAAQIEDDHKERCLYHDGKYIYNSIWERLGLLPAKLTAGMTRDEALSACWTYKGVRYASVELIDRQYDGPEGSVYYSDTFSGDKLRRLQAMDRFIETSHKRLAKAAAKHKARYDRTHPEKKVVPEKPAPPLPRPVNVIPFAEAARKEKARKAVARAEHDEKNRRARELLRAHDRVIHKRERAAGLSRGIQLGVKQW